MKDILQLIEAIVVVVLTKVEDLQFAATVSRRIPRKLQLKKLLSVPW